MLFFVILTTLVVLYLFGYFLKNRKFSKLPSPGICLPIIGHAHKVMTEESQRDSVFFLWNLYRQHSRNGMMWMRTFSLDLLFVGDFATLKYIFNHPDVQVKLTSHFETLLV